MTYSIARATGYSLLYRYMVNDSQYDLRCTYFFAKNTKIFFCKKNAKNRFLRFASHAWRQVSVTGRGGGGGGGINKFWGRGTKSLILRVRECGPKKKGLHLEICADFHKFWGEDKKKALYLKK